MRISARSAAALAARVRGGSSDMHDLPEMFGGFLTSNANGPHVGEDTWPWRNHETVDPCRKSARCEGGERSERESAPFDRSKSYRCGRCFQRTGR